MGIPQIIIIVFYTLALGIALAKASNGVEETKSFLYELIMYVTVMFLLWWGGFF